ncbi:alpha-ribazole phosphatase [Porphyromonas sp.]|uniref:alpha-ribazole phosphatase n=1 Tax=Porphyromonas sp. TaxID=1924944 RepID=UPI0026DDA5FC|nr:alpha-ribazole phosphatase [Porphyromonas sp.]MDO4695176.1 alpha-ribazole phosphatase [Porphyromonas sp.]MDO4770922.1 alpha-ribazole phosphatase [Porphyromonas sp.]
MTLSLLRHTQVSLPPGICYGQMDVALSSSYAEEWEKISSSLGGKTFGAVFSSPLSRCKLLANYLSPTAIEDPRLMELNFGVWEGWQWDDIYSTREGKEWFDDYVNTPTPNGESYFALIQRVHHFICDLHQKGGEEILIVTHAGVIRAFMHLLDGISVDEAFQTPIDYGALITYPHINLSSFIK